MAELEHIPAEESKQIENIIRLTLAQIRRRYPGEKPFLRGVHTKDHGCVTAKFKVQEELPSNLRVGLFAEPGREYDCYVRYSNAAAIVGADSPSQSDQHVHGSRGMAVKVLRVQGQPLLPTDGPITQDFLMVNHPVFPIANVEDYEALSEVLWADNDNPGRFFADRVRKSPDGKPDANDPMTRRTLRTLGIVRRIQSLSPDVDPAAFQRPPASPLDNEYFSAAPFLFGEGRVMKFRARPVAPETATDPDVADQGYLRSSLLRRLTAAGAREVVFDFQVQIRDEEDLAGRIDTEIEDACCHWEETRHPFVSVATIVIPPQDFDTRERRILCEDLIFTPWHGLSEHRPVGGINRMRRAVYEASACFRHVPKEPARL
jgi:hypothetical protein